MVLPKAGVALPKAEVVEAPKVVDPKAGVVDPNMLCINVRVKSV